MHIAGARFVPLFVRLHGPRCLELAAHHTCRRTRRRAHDLAAAVAVHLSRAAPDSGLDGAPDDMGPCEASAGGRAEPRAAESRVARRRVEAVATVVVVPAEAEDRFQEARVFFTGPRLRRHECD